MAERYDVLSSLVQDELRGGTTLVPVRVLTVVTKPTGIQWEERFDVAGFSAAAAGAYLALQAVLIESIAQDPRVIAMQYEQDVNVAGQLLDVFEIWVQSTSGASSSSFTHLYNDLSLQVVDPLITAQVALLDSLENL